MDKTTRIKTACLGAGLLALMLLAGVLLRDVVPPADRWLVDHVTGAPGSAPADIATAISGAGTMLFMAALAVGAVAVAVVVRRRGDRAAGRVAAILATVPVTASILLLQGLFLRSGPPRQPQLGTYPSGHVAVVAALGFAAVLLYRELGRTWHRIALAGAIAAVALVSASRIVLAEHWLLDTAGSVAGVLGIGLLMVAALRLRTPAHLRRI